MKPTHKEFERTKWLCSVLREAGFAVQLRTIGDFEGQQAIVILEANKKTYRFSDPSWDIVNKQLAHMVNALVMSH